jgi:hypothetical protein
MDDRSLEAVLSLIKQMEVTLLGLKQVRGYLDNRAGREIVDRLIEEGEANLADVKRKLIQ